MKHPFLRAKDAAAFAIMKDAVSNGEAIAFVGAGVSARVGYGDWPGLLDKLGGKLRESTPKAAQIPNWSGKLDDLAWIAEIYRKQIGEDAYAGLLTQHFAANNSNDAAIDHLAAAEFTHIITTNYDDSLERALARHGKKPQAIKWSDEDDVKILMESFSTRPQNPLVVYLHGRFSDPANIVLSERDYVSTYVKSDFTVRKLFAIFSTRRVVFFGFSLTDPDVTSVFRQVNSIHREPRHFAVLGLDSNEAVALAEYGRERFKEKLGIVPIFFRATAAKGRNGPAAKDRYHRLVEILRLLSSEEPTTTRRGQPAVTTRSSVSRRKWTSTPEFRSKTDPSDPQKGRFGGLAERDGYRLRADVKETRPGSGWFRIFLKVERTDGKRMDEAVKFYVHDSFPKKTYDGQREKRAMAVELGAYGAFTVGALTNHSRTPLELDLAQDPDADPRFRER